MEEQVKEYAIQWEKEHGRRFFVHGMSVQDYIETTWKEFNENKLREKEERVNVYRSLYLAFNRIGLDRV